MMSRSFCLASSRVWSIRRDLLTHPETKPVRADDASSVEKPSWRAFRMMIRRQPLPVNQVDDLALLRPRRELDDRPVACPDRIEIAQAARRGRGKPRAPASSSMPDAACGTACLLDAFAIVAIRPAL